METQFMQPRFIKLTLHAHNKSIYLNTSMIGDISQSEGYTIVGHLTHNNGGFKVKETIEEILVLIHKIDD